MTFIFEYLSFGTFWKENSQSYLILETQHKELDILNVAFYFTTTQRYISIHLHYEIYIVEL
jgi:hypothetical protein